MKKSILATAIMLASAGAFATGADFGHAGASIHGAGISSTSASSSAFATGNGASNQFTQTHSAQSIHVDANTICTSDKVGARLDAATSGSSYAAVAGSTSGTAFGVSEAGAIQGSGVIGHGSVGIVNTDTSYGAVVGGAGHGSVGLAGAQGSGAYVRNTNDGNAYQVSGADFENYAGVKVEVDADADWYGDSDLDMSVKTEVGSEGYSFAGGEVTDAFGVSGAGYLQGSYAKGGAVGGAVEKSKFLGKTNVAAAGGAINAKSIQGSAGGALNVGDGLAQNSSVTAASQNSYMDIEVEASYYHGASANVNHGTSGHSGAATYTMNDNAIGGTVAGAHADGETHALQFVKSKSECYSSSCYVPEYNITPIMYGNPGNNLPVGRAGENPNGKGGWGRGDRGMSQ